MAKAEVIGLGRSGIAAAKVLNQDGWDVTLGDAATEQSILSRSNGQDLQASIQELQRSNIAVKLEHSLSLEAPNKPDLIIVSPGVPWDLPILNAARNQGIDTIGEIELAWRYLSTTPWLGITGTNGKTTTTALVAAMFKAAGLSAPACGNIGYAACELVLQRNQPENNLDWIIAELSSYQIEASSQLQPQIGIWTTFSADHLSRHRTLENYSQIKASLLARSRQAIFNGDDPYLRNLGKTQWQNAYWTTVADKDNLIRDFNLKRDRLVYIEDSWIVAFGELILPLSLFKMPGKHNQQNLLLAVAAARLAGIEKKAITEAIANFDGVPHRLEYIKTYQGIDYINDSKATNYDAAEVALASVTAPVILIAGGQAKPGNDRSWIKQIKNQASFVLLIGEAATDFAQRLTEFDYTNYEIVDTLDNAVMRSAELAIKNNAKVVLLSPACASFDQYLSFEHRGDHFRELCNSHLD